MSPGKHGPNRLHNYWETHTTIMGQFVLEGFVLKDELVLGAFGDGFLSITGVVTCIGSIYLRVEKFLLILNGQGRNALVQTTDYHYNAVLEGVGNVIRYDSPHRHRPYHHVHRFDVLNGDKDGAIEKVETEDERVTLGDVIHGLRDWYYDNYHQIRRVTDSGGLGPGG